MTDYTELIKALRVCKRYPESCLYCVEENDYCRQRDMCKAADAIEELGNKLCDWCGVCPKEKRSVWNCEIAFPNAPIPEVWIEPTKEETE